MSPTHVYTRADVFTVTLTAGDGVISDTLSRVEYIKAFGPDEPQAGFIATPLTGTTPLTVTFVNQSINTTN